MTERIVIEERWIATMNADRAPAAEIAGRPVVDGGELQTADEREIVQMWRARAGGWRRE